VEEAFLFGSFDELSPFTAALFPYFFLDSSMLFYFKSFADFSTVLGFALPFYFSKSTRLYCLFSSFFDPYFLIFEFFNASFGSDLNLFYIVFFD
jgi:hypothetical protein